MNIQKSLNFFPVWSYCEKRERESTLSEHSSFLYYNIWFKQIKDSHCFTASNFYLSPVSSFPFFLVIIMSDSFDVNFYSFGSKIWKISFAEFTVWDDSKRIKRWGNNSNGGKNSRHIQQPNAIFNFEIQTNSRKKNFL